MTTRRLLGKTALVTRPKEQARELQEALEAQGATVALQPAIEILPPDNWADVDDALTLVAAGKVDWTIFSSSNGVRFVCDRLASTFPELARRFADLTQIAAVGSGTANALRARELEASLVPPQFDADSLVDAFVDRLGSSLAGLTFLSFRASRGRKTLIERLTALGANVLETTAYRSVDVKTPRPAILDALRSGKIDVAIASSSASARSLAEMFGEAAKKTRWIAISPLTADALRQNGLDVAAIAVESTVEGLVDAVVRATR
ncbi:MAG: uroporphyrinogen-III synthase [Thermoguttaceae bacterium]|nr:uroporphyrinogen-III synthase [Thermoguttaceae bacterium]